MIEPEKLWTAETARLDYPPCPGCGAADGYHWDDCTGTDLRTQRKAGCAHLAVGRARASRQWTWAVLAVIGVLLIAAAVVWASR